VPPLVSVEPFVQLLVNPGGDNWTVGHTRV
jgi:hypothetical protein